MNEHRRKRKVGALTESLELLEYGKTAEGYWGFAQFHEQMEDVLTFEALHPKHQIVLEVDWSQGHAKKTLVACTSMT